MKFSIVTTSDSAYKDALEVRKEVFVQEQNVPEELEIDEREAESLHFVLYDEDKPVGSARLRPIDDGAKVERVCILKSYRNKNLGALMMRHMEQVAVKNQYPALLLYAQVQAKDFYKKLGYDLISEETFLDADIPHVAMKKVLGTS